MNDELSILLSNIRQESYPMDCTGKSYINLDDAERLIKEAWNTRPEQEEYKEFEFCKDVGCVKHFNETKWIKEHCGVGVSSECKFTAIQFIRWVRQHNYKIVKTKEG